MFFSSHYAFPVGILDFLTHQDTVQVACLNRSLCHEIRPVLSKRRIAFFQSLMRYFHSSHSLIFSLHRNFHDSFERNLQSLFRMIPDWFQYIETKKIAYLDVSNPTYHTRHVTCFPASQVDQICEEFMIHLSHNTTLTYCNLGLLHHFLSRHRIEQAVRHHPKMSHVELILYSHSAQEPNSLYRVGDGTFEWRQYPPRN